MRRVFVKVKSVAQALGGIESIRNRVDGIESLMLLTGSKGVGKTRLAFWLLANFPYICYVRMKFGYSGGRLGWLLRDLLRELGLPPGRSLEEIYGQIISAAREQPRIFILDEIQHLATSSRLIEAIRDIHDDTGGAGSFVFVGEPGTDKLLMRFPSLFDRISEHITLGPLDREDIDLIIGSMLEVEMEPDSIQAFVECVEPRMRPVIVSLYRLERWAKLTKNEITPHHVQGLFSGKGLSRPSAVVRAGKAAVSAA